MEEEKILDWSTLEITKALIDMLKYLRKRGIVSVHDMPDGKGFIMVTKDFFDRNFPEGTDRAMWDNIEVMPFNPDCASK